MLIHCVSYGVHFTLLHSIALVAIFQFWLSPTITFYNKALLSGDKLLPLNNMPESLGLVMLNIYLADLANDLLEIDNKSVPIGVGYIGAFCAKQYESKVNIRLFRTADPLLKACRKNPPDIVGFGSYDWNHHLSLKLTRWIKEQYPNCLTIFGGAYVDKGPANNAIFLQEHASVDAVVFGDGEYPFSNIIELRLENNKDPVKALKSTPLDGVRSLFQDKLIMGKPINLVKDLASLPSPYLTGLLDEYVANPLLMPIIQNVRGCPFTCSFCVSGSQSGKLRSFPLERVCSEISYLKTHAKNRILRFSDDNFGIFKNDVEIARFIKETHHKHGYPTGLKIYSSKHLNDRTREVALLLKDLSLMNVSFQTLNPIVLKNIKRHHNSLEEIKKNLHFARQHNIATGTELIFGLPGETLESFKQVIDKTIELRFDSVILGVLWLLPGAELYTQEARE